MPNTPVPGAATPIKRKMTKQEIADRTEAQLEQKMRGERYARYLDAMVEHMGDQELALADVYGIKVEDVRVRRLELQADVRQGIGKTQLSDVLERADLNIQSRVSLLRRHAFSNNPAASLKAIDMIQDLEGDRADHGSFESYLRLVKGKE
jgi:hypothetical protein